MGNDSSGDSIYRFCSAKVLDTHLLNSSYASQLTDHQFNQEMQRGQRSDKNPQQYVCDQVYKAYKIHHTNQDSQQYWCSQIYEGFRLCVKGTVLYFSWLSITITITILLSLLKFCIQDNVNG
jgi:regulatory protein YycI of two-component signal transduction system YycFG